MKISLISDNLDTLTGLRLVGINGVIVHTKEEFEIALNNILEDKEIGILLLMETHAREFCDLVDRIKLNSQMPLIVEIPDRHGSGRREDFISFYIKEAIGLKLN